MIITAATSAKRLCQQCGGKLQLVGTSVDTMGGIGTPITTKQYKCLDVLCQDRKDKEENLRIETYRARAEKSKVRKTT